MSRLEQVADAVCQALSEVNPLGLTQRQAHELARRLDLALAANAPKAPPPRVVPITWGRRVDA